MKNKLFNILLFAFSLFILYCSLFTVSVFAASPTPTSDSLQNIKQQLITNIASKVAELKLVEKRGIIGKVSDISNTQITLTDTRGNIRFADVDELTKFSSPSQKGAFGISDINKGDTLGILGLYNKESRRILSRFVNTLTFPMFIHGVISSIDSQNYIVIVKTEDKKYNVDVQTTTKTFSYTTAGGLVKAGFSKIIVGQNIIIVGSPDNKDSNLINASRIIIFPEIATNPNITVVSPSTDNPTIVPSTGSGKKLTPIVK